MLEISDEKFAELVSEAWKKIPKYFHQQMDNLAIRIEQKASPEQLHYLKTVENGLKPSTTVLGLFEGTPKTAWGQDSIGTQPSKITIFQEAILNSVATEKELNNLLLEVLMHEVAHYFGYNDNDMRILDEKLRRKLKG